jgi:pantoate--beta-alanine ligase
LFRALTAANNAYHTGENNADRLRQTMTEAVATEPLARLQYVSCADYDTLAELETVTGKALLSMAVFIGKTRLIDNFIIG